MLAWRTLTESLLQRNVLFELLRYPEAPLGDLVCLSVSIGSQLRSESVVSPKFAFFLYVFLGQILIGKELKT